MIAGAAGSRARPRIPGATGPLDRQVVMPRPGPKLTDISPPLFAERFASLVIR